MQTWIQPVTLTGDHVLLRPLEDEDLFALHQTITPGLLKWFAIPGLNAEGMISFKDFHAVYQQQMKQRVIFATCRKDTGEIVGNTSYLTIEPAHRGLEIGGTWIRKEEQSTRINPEAKYLMLKHAFETLGAIRVSLKTHHLNTQSQRAIEKLGAQKEGVLRNHIIMPDGSYRHSVMYSILDTEWPEVKRRLEKRID
ncbi:GNAT family N-acetyltransferase [Deinococcus cellulosilyticus]|uniref:N-acetyltransferase n=1 Tax=Deinococcus cellulosilyticus (strain DSM 18568 / NBRC 106333 / KACC 11606 / 5516J-15) TaxID=1223518 RepID=A0A511N7U0_DEIC1|nr:GNAT family protein [Deinococcus cellulosilyticus]GEM48481.1 N-acetyltransferase [Deinococcus cellulosilyticus NBRC 106333 = KACC 11606]